MPLCMQLQHQDVLAQLDGQVALSVPCAQNRLPRLFAQASLVAVNQCSGGAIALTLCSAQALYIPASLELLPKLLL